MYGVSEVSLKQSGQIKLLEHSCFRMPSLRQKSASPRDYVVGYAIPAVVLIEVVMKGKHPSALHNNPLVNSEVN